MIISLFFGTLMFFMMIAFIFGAPLVPSKKPTALRMIELLKIKPGEIVYDLGSGDGRLLILAAKQGAIAVGIEINPYAVLWSRFMAWRAGVSSQVSVKWGNYWWVDLSKADKISVYLLPNFMKKLSGKLQKEVKKGTLIASNAFSIPELKLIKQEEIGKERVYLYKI